MVAIIYMPSRRVTELMWRSPIDQYLEQCQVRNSLVESENTTHVPPNAKETRELLAFLKKKGINAVIVGSVGVLHYVRHPDKFRPTVDLDLFVPISYAQLRRLVPPKGWRVDAESVGVISWIAPSGGYTDFLTSGKVFPDGGITVPERVATDASSKTYPVAKAVELFRFKLATMRDKDLFDCVSLARSIGGVPTDKELGKLSQLQKENLVLVRQWYAMRPEGSYGQ